MKLPKSIELHNYRSHEQTKVELGPATALVGENDAGKSTILRAAEMVLFNAPFPDGALRYGTKEGYVRVEFDDGTWIQRDRKGSKQTATIFDGDRRVIYDTVKDIGMIVQDFTGFRPVVLDKNSRPESVQIIPIDAGPAQIVSGASPDGVLRRVSRLMGGVGVETARVVLERDLRALQKANVAQEEELKRREAVYALLTGELWDEAATEIGACQRALSEVGDAVDRLEILREARECVGTFEAVGRARAAVEGLDEAMKVAREMSCAIEDARREIAMLASRKDVVAQTMETLREAYDQDDELSEAVGQSHAAYMEALDVEREVQRREELRRTNICPTCGRPI